MQYNRCIVSKPGLLDNVVVDFDKSLTVVSGKNGSGKSLMARCLIEGIWRRFSSYGMLPDDLWNSLFIDVRFQLDDNSSYQFSNNSSRYLTIRSLNSSQDSVIYSDDVSDNGSNGRIDIEKISNGSMLKSFIRDVDLSSFASTSYIPSPTDMGSVLNLDYQSIREIILTDSTGFYKKFHELKSWLSGKEGSRNLLDKSMNDLMTRIHDIEKKVQLFDIKNSRVSKLRIEKNEVLNELKVMESSLQRLKNRHEVLSRILDNLGKANEFRENYNRISSEFEDEKRKRKTATEIRKELDKLFPQFRNMHDLDSGSLDKLQEIYSEIRSLNEKIDKFFDKRELMRNRLKNTGLVINLSAFSVIFSILYNNGFSFREDLFLLAGIFGFSLISSLLLILYSIISSKSDNLMMFSSEKSGLEEKLKKILNENNVELEGYKLSELYEFLLQYFEEYIEFTEKSKDLIIMEDSLKDNEHLKKIKNELSQLKKLDNDTRNEINNCINSLEDNSSIELESRKISELITLAETDIRNISRDIELKKKILSQIDSEIGENPEDKSTIELLDESRTEVSEKLHMIKSTDRSLKFITEVMEEAVKLNEEKQLSRLINLSFDHFNFITENKEIGTVDKNLIKGIIVENIRPAELNAQTVHLLYLSVKLALTGFLKDNNLSLPFIIDDPFLFMDDDRINRFRELITGISRQRQVIIFTHRRDKKDWGNFIEI